MGRGPEKPIKTGSNNIENRSKLFLGEFDQKNGRGEKYQCNMRIVGWKEESSVQEWHQWLQFWPMFFHIIFRCSRCFRPTLHYVKGTGLRLQFVTSFIGFVMGIFPTKKQPTDQNSVLGFEKLGRRGCLSKKRPLWNQGHLWFDMHKKEVRLGRWRRRRHCTTRVHVQDQCHAAWTPSKRSNPVHMEVHPLEV